MPPRISPLSSAVLLTLSAPAFSQPGDTAAPPSAVDLDTVRVLQAHALKPASPKYTETLLDTPQTITVVTKHTMDQQNLLSLKDVLSTLPGITFGAGEGGGGYGDSINLRGFTASSDITTDGVRDSAQYSRSDTFNLESIELINGANSAMSGAGSVGGNINLVTKRAVEGDFNHFTVGAGSDRYGRVTADSNHDFGNGTAVRLNAMGHTQDVPGRDEEFRHRWGFAPSLALGLGSDTRLTLNYLHQHDNNLPQYGVPFALSPFNHGPLPGVRPNTYFGYRNTSRQEINVDMLTGVLEMDFSPDVQLRSLARLQRVEQTTNVTALQGAWCLPDHTDPYTGRACASSQAPATWNPNNGPRGLVRDSENFIAHSQTDLTATLRTGNVEHHAVAGIAFSKEDFELNSAAAFRNANGSAAGIVYPLQSFRNPYNIWTGPQHEVRTGRSEGSLNNQAAYLFDTLVFNPQWMLNLGMRYEHNTGDSTLYTVNSAGNITDIAAGFPAGNQNDLFSYRAGLVFKPADNASLYLSYANSKTPSKASVNGSCTPVATSISGTNCNADPETAVNVELGGKWDVLDQRLALTTAVFRNARQNYKVNSGDPLQPEQVMDGKARVNGIALGAAGHLSQAWSIFANYTFLDSEVLQSVSNRVRQASGDPIAGRELVQTPRHAGNVWSVYELGRWDLGYGIAYQGRFYANNTSAAAYVKTASAWVHRAMVGLRINDWVSLQLNLNNLFDKVYYTSIRNNLSVNANGTVTTGNGWAIPGDGRSATLTATFAF